MIRNYYTLKFWITWYLERLILKIRQLLCHHDYQASLWEEDEITRISKGHSITKEFQCVKCGKYKTIRVTHSLFRELVKKYGLEINTDEFRHAVSRSYK